jgi:hypothetical protein
MAVSNNACDIPTSRQDEMAFRQPATNLLDMRSFVATEDLILAKPRRRFRTGIKWQYVLSFCLQAHSSVLTDHGIV